MNSYVVVLTKAGMEWQILIHDVEDHDQAKEKALSMSDSNGGDWQFKEFREELVQ